MRCFWIHSKIDVSTRRIHSILMRGTRKSAHIGWISILFELNNSHIFPTDFLTLTTAVNFNNNLISLPSHSSLVYVQISDVGNYFLSQHSVFTLERSHHAHRHVITIFFFDFCVNGRKREKTNLKLSNAFGTADKSVTMMTSVELDTIKREENERWWNMVHTQFLCLDNDDRRNFFRSRKNRTVHHHIVRILPVAANDACTPNWSRNLCDNFRRNTADILLAFELQDTVKLSYHSNFSVPVHATSVKSQFVTKLKTPEREFHAWQRCRALHAYTLYWFL